MCFLIESTKMCASLTNITISRRVGIQKPDSNILLETLETSSFKVQYFNFFQYIFPFTFKIVLKFILHIFSSSHIFSHFYQLHSFSQSLSLFYFD